MQLSPHFELSEFTRSYLATRLRLDNTPPDESIGAIQALCLNALEPLRMHFGRPVHINSGYRSPALNRAVGGVRSSQHIWTAGWAAVDLEIPGIPNQDVFDWLVANVPFDQLIAEFMKTDDPAAGWAHLSYSLIRNRKQVIRIG